MKESPNIIRVARYKRTAIGAPANERQQLTDSFRRPVTCGATSNGSSWRKAIMS